MAKDLQSFVISFGIPAECFAGLDSADMPAYNDAWPDWANLLVAGNWAEAKADRYHPCAFACDRVGIRLCEAKVAAGDVETASLLATDSVFRAMLGMASETVADNFRAGVNVPKDAEAAMRYYRKVVAYGLGDRPFAVIGDMYYTGDGVAVDYQKALVYYLRAGDKRRLGDYYCDGLAQKADYQKALDYYKQYEEKSGSYAALRPAQFAALYRKMARCAAGVGEIVDCLEYTARAGELQRIVDRR